MRILDWLRRLRGSGGASVQQPAPEPTSSQSTRRQPLIERSRRLVLEGTKFPLFTGEDTFFEACRKSGQAALALRFSEFWSAFHRGFRAKAIGGGVRLLCSSCLVDMAMSFQMTLPGGMSGDHMLAIGEGLPSNLFDAAKAARCPNCGSDCGILLWDHPQYGDITEQDMQLLRHLWRFRSQLWWNLNNRLEGLCDRCFATKIPRGEGYHRGSDLICERCAADATNSVALAALRSSPDYYGMSELRRARNLNVGTSPFEKGSILDTA